MNTNHRKADFFEVLVFLQKNKKVRNDLCPNFVILVSRTFSKTSYHYFVRLQTVNSGKWQNKKFSNGYGFSSGLECIFLLTRASIYGLEHTQDFFCKMYTWPGHVYFI